MSETCTHDMAELERLELTVIEEPMRCDMCTGECDIGIRYATELGRIALCTDCLRVIEIVANKHVEGGDLNE